VKAFLRKKVTDARDSLTQEERQMKSRSIENRLFLLPDFKAASTIMFFASFRSEVDTVPMIRKALAEGKRVVLPKVKGKNLALFEIREFDKDIHAGAWGIPEPHENKPAFLADVELIIVPGLAFDERGNRLGYGKGYYDKLLSAFPKTTAALAFEAQIVPEVPVTEHDIPVKLIVTEKRVIAARPPQALNA
jgi:5-formyltetrahydrofolate cyclo-ligase